MPNIQELRWSFSVMRDEQSILRPYRKDNIYFRTIEEREKIRMVFLFDLHIRSSNLCRVGH